MIQSQSTLECYKCTGCGHTTIEPKKRCRKCGGKEIEAIETDGRGKVLDFTTIYFPPDNYKDLSPYTSVLVQLDNGCKFFGIVTGERKDLIPGAPVTMVSHDQLRGMYFFQPD